MSLTETGMVLNGGHTGTVRTRTAMVDVKGAAYLRGEHVRVIEQLVAGGNLLGKCDPHERGFEWVWNFAVNLQGKERCLRLWSLEVVEPDVTATLKLPAVIGRILPPTRTNFPVGEVCKIFLLTYDHLRALKFYGHLPENDLTPRTALEKFLTERLLTK